MRSTGNMASYYVYVCIKLQTQEGCFIYFNVRNHDNYSHHICMQWKSPLVARFPPIPKLSIQDTILYKKLYLTSVTETHEH